MINTKRHSIANALTYVLNDSNSDCDYKKNSKIKKNTLTIGLEDNDPEDELNRRNSFAGPFAKRSLDTNDSDKDCRRRHSFAGTLTNALRTVSVCTGPCIRKKQPRRDSIIKHKGQRSDTLSRKHVSFCQHVCMHQILAKPEILAVPPTNSSSSLAQTEKIASNQ
ncbi:uncharacterized protein LOC121379318 [Gigantopelta aegis]|uniref:uncharacterized protein LOC121379318 n=1 Tax=Gigantopelta aegis TaxID=1735272 RepID=UPI001B88D352|nr:uncharacterized protein LOC121379318 [Gigantopelta aegis]XP_041363824.1 uncharacterized protein LOC121379318 [Gigantopelta aegis]XP_041363825.1 uncharacterized protein LOC121379318 [Gigantopelta aegis]